MRFSLSTCYRAALVLLTISHARESWAESERVFMVYHAESGCPDGEAFLRSVQERTTRFELAQGKEPARQIVATVTESGTGFLGRLEVTDPTSGSSLRSVHGAVCEEVVTALSLMVALAIDPQARTMVA